MLHAVLNNKHKRDGNFSICEDTLTSSIFGRLIYLPNIWDIIRSSIYHNKDLPKQAFLQSVDFWPKWSSEKTSNATFVEPDILLRFEKFDLIVEAKRWDEKQQSVSQWENECQAYFNEYESENKDLHFLALGGLHTEKNATVEIEGKESVRIYKARWSNILEFVKKLEDKGNATFLERDIIASFRIHGFMVGEWLSTLPTEKIDGKINFWKPPTASNFPDIKLISKSIDISNDKIRNWKI
jgi:hypothetical protein